MTSPLGMAEVWRKSAKEAEAFFVVVVVLF